jgi:organic radical activating enzyme
LVQACKAAGYALAIETNGTVNLDGLGLDWICVSPKVAEHALKQRTAQEVKYVRAYGQGIPKPTITAEHYVLSPAFDGDHLDPQTWRWCLQLCQTYPEWRLSLQQHKLWGVR